MRTEKIVKKEESNLNMPAITKRKFTRAELDKLVLKLAEVHGLI